MGVTTEDIKISKMSKEDRILFFENIIDVDGYPTTQGWEIIKGLIVKDYKALLVDMVEKVNESKTK